MDGWKGVELRHLAALAAIDEQRSFHGAADQLGYVQSAVSQQILQLEKLVGARLVDRSRGHAPPVQVTEAGRLLLAHGARIRAQLDAAQADLATLAAGTTRALRVGVVPSVASRLLPAVLTDLRTCAPGLAVGVAEAGDDDLRARVAAGALDVAVGELPPAGGLLDAVAVLDDPSVLLVPAGSPPTAAGLRLTLADLVAQPLVRLKGWPLLERIEQQLRAAGHPPSFVLSAEANGTVQALVGAGCGAAIVPRLAVAPGDPRVVALEVGDLLPARRLALLWRAERMRDGDDDAFAAAVGRAVAALGAPAVHGA